MGPKATKGRLKKKIKYFIIFVFVVVIGFVSVIYSPLLNIGYVNVKGNTTISRENVLNIAHLGEPLNVFYVSIPQVQNALESDLRIAKASVTRTGFNRIDIDIEERQPIAVLNTNYGFVEVDNQGVVLSAFKNLKKEHKPLISGYVAEDVYVGDKIDNDAVERVLAYIQQLNPAYRQNVVEVNMNNPSDIIVMTNNGAKIILGNIVDPHALAAQTNGFFDDLSGSELALDYVNFSYSRPVLKFKQ